MAPSRALFSSSSASSRHVNKARPASDDEDLFDGDASYHRVKKSSALSSKSSAHKSSSTSAPRSKRPLEEEEVRAVKKPATNKRHDDGSDNEAISSLSDELLTERRAYDEWVDKKLSKLTSKREQMLEERLDRIRAERDEIQSQYDELRQLRTTAPEEALDEFKKTAEARYRHDKDLINSLKVKIEAAEKRASEAAGGTVGDRSVSILDKSVRESVAPEMEEMEKQHRRELAEAIKVQKRLEEEVRSYKLQLEQEVAQSKATRSINKPSETAASTSLAAMEDEKAVRKLYEDLTGLVITGVELIQPPSTLRRFKAIFAQEDYYSVLMDLEESTSKIAGGNKTRDDIVYVPKVEEDRDGELLGSKTVPQAWLEALRFERGMLFKWYEKTRRALQTDEAKEKTRVREERARARG
ncbi:hypothetical protein PSEUBRA_004298 [Kalmanozyma brasiliensis GHG001]|uniref:Monopolin complex subunit Csm1/Pcs1 C-terminal domain-containing protein n=1 Tax=Kalmanozyma brasiliensis (strain GHG001) TaxID=1365824 RepID=V5GKA7_KALBG|nr:uncharacterized protein PSEUBRA_004298 [Kalmanozyma brasiliensis GHG001]EST06402.1 hypothetical protein PSEUBRA_004298 [Kalmanozyma brasiliensis GHG001]